MVGPGATRWLLASGVAGPVLFVIAFLVEGATRADYDPTKVFVSQLSLGDQGWLQIANFVISGLLILGFAFGLRRAFATGLASRWGPITVGLVGLGLIISGVFVTDPALGYPPGTPPGLTQSPSWHGSLHLLGAAFVFAGLPIACFIFARRFRAEADASWSWYSIVSGVGLLVVFLLANASASSAGAFGEIAGLLQRISVAIGFLWLGLFAARLVRRELTATIARVRPG